MDVKFILNFMHSWTVMHYILSFYTLLQLKQKSLSDVIIPIP